MTSFVKYLITVLALLAGTAQGYPVHAQTVKVSTAFGTGADIELTENGGTGGLAMAGGNGTKVNFNARWNGTGNGDRNEWAAMRFDLSAQDDKTSLSNISLNFYMYRANAANNRNLHFYALVPGTTGEDWPEVGTTYATMPSFTFDMDSITRDLNSTITVDLGTFTTTGAELEGALSKVTLPALTTLIQGMGDHDLLSIFVTSTGSTNGQWRAVTKEAAGTETSVLTGAAGDFAPFLEFSTGATAVTGDFNSNGVVDAADYTVWRDHMGQTEPGYTLPHEDATIGSVTIEDYNTWKAHFGQNGSGAGATSAPEPTAFVLAAFAPAVLLLARRRKH